MFNFIKRFLLNYKGFSLIEALIAMVILTIGIVAVLSMQGTFATGTVDRTLLNALIDSASNALQRCQIDETTPNSLSYTQEGINVSVTLSASCSPSLNTCNDVTATATARGKTYSISTKVCKFD